jgi:hypothetical protein
LYTLDNIFDAATFILKGMPTSFECTTPEKSGMSGPYKGCPLCGSPVLLPPKVKAEEFNMDKCSKKFILSTSHAVETMLASILNCIQGQALWPSDGSNVVAVPTVLLASMILVYGAQAGCTIRFSISLAPLHCAVG